MPAVFQPLSYKRALDAALAIAGVSLATLVLPGTMRGIFSSKFLPHAYCYLYNRNLIVLHVVSDGFIWLSYVAISLTLVYLVYRTRREIPFSWVFLAFGTFIIACGFTHLMEVIVLWNPVYWLTGGVKLVTAIASVITAIALPPQLPKVRQMIVAAEVSEERQRRLEQTNEELSQANQHLRSEITKRITAEESLRHLSGSLLQAQDDERRRFARELHDSVGQLLTGAVLSVSAVRRQETRLGHKSSRLLSECADSVKQSLREIRTISYLLHPPMLDETGLGDAIRWYVRGFAERSGVQVDLDISSNLDQLSRELSIAVFRIVQESLTNIHRHSGSRTAEISLRRCGPQIQLQVRDHGKGTPPESMGSNGRERLMHGVGIRGMRERVVQLKGEMRMQSSGRGTVLEVVLPLHEDSVLQAETEGKSASATVEETGSGGLDDERSRVDCK
jgi:signal transduction histidine kinase